MDGQTDGGDYNVPFAFLKKRGDNYSCNQFIHPCPMKMGFGQKA